MYNVKEKTYFHYLWDYFYSFYDRDKPRFRLTLLITGWALFAVGMFTSLFTVFVGIALLFFSWVFL